MNKRDLLLQQMGINQWRLHRPEALKGMTGAPIANNIQLIIIAKQELDKQQSLIKDILLSLEILPQNCLSIDFNQAKHLNINHQVNYWLLSNEPHEIEDIACPQAESIWHTTDWQQFQQNPQAKRQLWQQIQQA